ncbi:MAG: hypothetical protein IJV22_01410 [Bacteroidales bacterium]|nr:hypothetical protein [Bacteroidales bacterium]
MKAIKTIALVLMMCGMATAVHAQKWGKTPEDSVDCFQNTSFYQQHYKMKDYIGAYDPWKIVLQKCPANNKNIYIRGAVILKAKINAAKTAEEREVYFQELMHMYDLRIQYFGEAVDVLAKKALEVEQLKGPSAVNMYYPIYDSAIKLSISSKVDIDAQYAYKYFEATERYVKANAVATEGTPAVDPSLVVDNYDIVSEILEQKLRNERDSVKADQIQKYIINVENVFSPYASCEQLTNIYQKKFEAAPNDLELLKKITDILDRKKCSGEELYFKATEKMHELAPSPATARRMGVMCYNKKQYNQAINYLQEAAKDLEDEREKYQAYIVLGHAYSENNSYSAARAAYRNASRIDPSKGEPYLHTARLYAKSARSIDDGLGGASAYWAAYDEAVRARNIDNSPENVEKANELTSRYGAYFPKKEKAFDLDLVDGQSFTIPGWIGEHTIVRTRK